MFYTDNPVRDAERYQQYLEDRDYITCDICGGKIYRENNIYEGDEYYQIEDQNICQNCINDFLKERKVPLSGDLTRTKHFTVIATARV